MMAMATPISSIFKSTKPHIPRPSNFESLKPTISSKSRKSDAIPSGNEPEKLSCNNNSRKKRSLWCVYLILSTNPPIKTYVGVTTNFSRRGYLCGENRLRISKRKREGVNFDKISEIRVILLISTSSKPKRLKEHNGEIKGGAKASCSGRPWICACLIRGFKGRSEACAFESKWKQISRKLPRKRKSTTAEQRPEDNGSFALLQHRHVALDCVQSLIDCSNLNIDWRSNFSD